MRQLFQLVGTWWNGWREARRAPELRLHCTAEFLLVESQPGRPRALPWLEMVEVVAFKQDCYVVDSIRLLITMADGSRHELAEHDAGFDEAVAQLSERLQGCLRFEDWFFRVAFPAFETNLTRLYPPSGV